MTPLRQRMLQDLRVRNYATSTQQIYILQVARFAQHFGKSPAELGPEEVQRYQLHLVETGISWCLFRQELQEVGGTASNRAGQPRLVF